MLAVVGHTSVHLSIYHLSLSDIKFATVIVLKEGFAMCVALADLVGTHSNPTASASWCWV